MKSGENREAQNPMAFDDLYREVILDHYRNPRNKADLPGASVVAEGMNPSCGDEIRVALAVEDDQVREVRFTGLGCSISQCSASMLTEEAAGRSLDATRRLSRDVQEMLTHENFDVDTHDVGELEALSGVARFPVRIKCALLAWKVLDQAIAELTGTKIDRDSDIQTSVASSAN